MKEKITIYTNDTCPYCKTIKDILEKENVKFKEKLITEFEEEWGEVSNLPGLPTLPTLFFNEEYFAPGRDFFSPEHLIEVIKTAKKSKYDYPVRSFERIKTLNFNIFTAFQRVQQILQQIENNTKKEIENEYKSTD